MTKPGKKPKTEVSFTNSIELKRDMGWSKDNEPESKDFGKRSDFVESQAKLSTSVGVKDHGGAFGFLKSSLVTEKMVMNLNDGNKYTPIKCNFDGVSVGGGVGFNPDNAGFCAKASTDITFPLSSGGSFSPILKEYNAEAGVRLVEGKLSKCYKPEYASNSGTISAFVDVQNFKDSRSALDNSKLGLQFQQFVNLNESGALTVKAKAGVASYPSIKPNPTTFVGASLIYTFPHRR